MMQNGLFFSLFNPELCSLCLTCKSWSWCVDSESIFTNFPLNNCQMKYHLLLQILHSCVTQYLFEGQVEDSYCWCFESLGSDLLSSEFLVLESKSLKSESLKSESESHCCPSWKRGRTVQVEDFPVYISVASCRTAGIRDSRKKMFYCCVHFVC